MPNPRFYVINPAEPTVELLEKLTKAKQVFFGNLEWFCKKHGIPKGDFEDIEQVYLIGSHANPDGWNDDTSDVDLKLVNPTAFPENLHLYKREVLNPHLCIGEKRHWIDLFFAREDYQVTDPKWPLIDYWNGIPLEIED